MSRAVQSQEPSMEEILASIRRIIADDASGLAQRVHEGLSASAGAQQEEASEPESVPDPDMDALFASHLPGGRADSDDEMDDENADPPPRSRGSDQETAASSVRPRLVDVSEGEQPFADRAQQRSRSFDFSEDPAPAFRHREDRPARTERPEKPERPAKPERPDMPGQPERPEKMERPEPAEPAEPVADSPESEPEDEAQQPAQAQQQPQPQNPPSSRQGQSQVVDERLLSPTVGAAVSGAFANLNSLVLSKEPRTLEDLMAEIIRPLLKTWLDQNLPILVERLVREEIERVSHRSGRR